MIRARILASSMAFVAIAMLAAAGCSANPSEGTPTSSTDTAVTRPPDLLAPCNLGEEFDRAAMAATARYDIPAVDEGLVDKYGPMIANGSCSDAQIIKWQELRREFGEADEICRITWYDDYFSAVTYPIGCAVPVMVATDASR